ncbi:hypothetical protein SLS62_002007 [Diatrype stigma]|uniref:Transcription factor domain-containing protein n=1 Tax=Diatrype stigma TaxID=117547 RepID=A0AAN9YVM3_9PEZI
MGLERDGVYLGLSPFETEMRRRIWWQLKMHDVRTAELCGIDKFWDLLTGVEYTSWSTNVNDDQLYPDMSSLQIGSNKLTDAIFVCVKCELLRFATSHIANLRRQRETSKLWDTHEPCDNSTGSGEHKEVEELLETKYLRYCDPSQPLDLLVMLFARSSINVVQFMSHHPRKWASREQMPPSARQWVWQICIKLLEQHNMLQRNPNLKQFAWQARYFQQWHAIIHILDTLRADPLKADADKAWKHIGSVYESNPDLIFEIRKPIHVAVGGLCSKAYSNREAALQNGNTRCSPTPHFIVQLRQQLGDARARSQELDANNGQPEESVGNGQANDASHDPRPDSDGSDSSKGPTSRPQPGRTADDTPGFLERDPFRFTYGLGNSQASDANNENHGLGFILDQTCDVEDSLAPAITWDQWDSWLADSNLIHPFLSTDDFTPGVQPHYNDVAT